MLGVSHVWVTSIDQGENHQVGFLLPTDEDGPEVFAATEKMIQILLMRKPRHRIDL